MSINSPPKKMLSLKQKKLKFAFQQPLVSSHLSLPTDLPSPPTITPSKPAHSSVVPSGLCNLGNTCYANCILQVLRFCPQFRLEVAKLSEVFSSPSAVGKSEEVNNRMAMVGAGKGEGELVVCLHMVRIFLICVVRLFESLSCIHVQPCMHAM